MDHQDTDPSPDEEPRDLELAADEQARRIAAMAPAERFALMDRLCREATAIAARARRQP